MVYASVGGYAYHSYVAIEFKNRKETSKGKELGALLLVALAVRLVVLFFFKRNIVLNEISLVLFIAVFVVAVIVMLVKWWKWRTK